MLAMKRGLDSITGETDETSNKRAKISPMQTDNADDRSSSPSDVEDIVDTYLQTCQTGGPSEGTINSWQDLQDFLENQQETGDNISNELANMSDTFLRTQSKEEKAKSLAQNI